MTELSNQKCPACGTNNLKLSEKEMDIPYFGKLFIFSMQCSNCNYSINDVEAEEKKEPARYTVTIDNEKDMQIRVIKSSSATVKIPKLKMSMSPGPASEGFVSNVEGVLDRFKVIIEQEKDNEEDEEVRKNAKNLLKKIWKIKLGDIPIEIIIEDPNGNSAIVSEKAKIEKLK